MKYWMDDLKENERAIYLGYITAENKAYDIDKDIMKELSKIRGESKEIRFRSLRELEDEYPCGNGACYGADVYAIIKLGSIKKNRPLINKMRECFDL